jgi:nucleoside-diphosphate-sugar epimerase
LGRVVCAHLAKGGHEVVAVDALYGAGLPVPLQVVNLLDRVAIYRHVEGCQAVVHLANHSDMRFGVAPQTIYAENVTMDANVFQAAVDVGARQIVFSSSVQVISNDRGGVSQLSVPSRLAYLPVDGNLPPACTNLYALGKVAAENMLKFYAERHPALSCTAMRFPWLATGAERLYTAGQNCVDLGKIDELFSYLAHADAASFIEAVLNANRPGYAGVMPAAATNRLGWPVADLVRTFYPTVPLRRPLAEMKTLIDLESLQAAYGWSPAHSYDIPRRKVNGVDA